MFTLLVFIYKIPHALLIKCDGTQMNIFETDDIICNLKGRAITLEKKVNNCYFFCFQTR